MIIDIAHSSVKTIDDILALSTRPMIVSHTGVKGTVNNNRNLSDDQLRRIAAKGGLIGIGFWEGGHRPYHRSEGDGAGHSLRGEKIGFNEIR